MKDLGQLHFFLDINTELVETSPKLHQKHYVQQLLKKCKMPDCKSVATPLATNVQLVKGEGSKAVDRTLYQSIVASLLYESTATRSDISHSVEVLHVSQFNSSPTKTHVTAENRVASYLKLVCGITFSKSDKSPLHYSDTNPAENYEERRLTSCNVIFSSNGSIM